MISNKTLRMLALLVMVTSTSFAQLAVTSSTIFLDGSEEGRGETHFTASGGVAPYTFSWMDGFSGKDRLGMMPGLYTTTIRDAANNEVTRFFPVGYKIFWTKVVDATSIQINSDNSLQKLIPPAAGGFNKGASSENKLSVGRDGWVGFVCEAPSTNWYAVGLSDLDTDPTLSSMDYVIANRQGKIEVYRNNGVIVYQDNEQLKAGEFLRLERRNGIVTAYRNNTGVHVFAAQTHEELLVDVSINIGKTPVISSSFAKPGSKVPPEYKPDENLDKNWVLSTSFDQQGNIASQSKTFFDNIGRTTQTQSKIIASANVFATQSLYDSKGRSVVSTLPAPIDNAAFNYMDKFMTDNSGQNYSYLNFDGAKIDNPDAVNNSKSGTLGYYYSSKNTIEPATPVTTYPYGRVQYDDDPIGGIKRSAEPGDQFRMGAGHESKGITLPILNELDHYVSLRHHFVASTITSFAYKGSKSISIDKNGKETVIFTDDMGQVVASCLSGSEYPAIEIVTNLEESPTCYFAAQHTRLSNQDGPVIVSSSYLEVYDVSDNYRPIFKGQPGSDFKDLLPFNTLLEFRSDKGFNIYFVNFPSIIPVRSSNIPGDNIIHRKNHVDLHISAGASATPVTVTGSGQTIKVYNRINEQVLYDGLPSGLTSLPSGFYRIVTQQGTGSYQITYNLHYGDFSYNYYDDAGRLSAVIPPNGVNLGNSAYPPFASTFQYNSTGLVLSAASPDEGTSEFVYRKDGVIRFSQNAQQKIEKRFSYTNYDRIGRIVESGEYQMSATAGEGLVFENHLTAAPSLNSVLKSEILESVQRDGGLDIARCTQRNEQWHDYPFSDPAIGTRTQQFVLGKVAKSKNENSTSWYSYDDQGRMVWVIQEIVGLGIKVIEYAYDNSGNCTEIAYQKNQPDAFYHHYTYDADSRLKKVHTSFDGVTKKIQATYDYYLHGPLKRIILADGLQGIDFVYAINGALKTINHPDQSKDPGKDTNDVFGITLEYHSNDYQGANYNAGATDLPGYTDQYNGVLKAMDWHSPANLNDPGVYAFTYDNNYQLKEATFGKLTVGAPNSFVLDPANDFTERVTEYDENGNIKGLFRNGLNINQVTNTTADFDYVYEPNTNRLDRIDKANGGSIDYTYNLIGQMIKQQEGTEAVNVFYNASGLVKEVRDESDNLMVSYLYNEHGQQTKRTIYKDGIPHHSLWSVCDLQGSVLAIYEQPLPAATITLSEIPVYGLGRIAVFKPSSNTYFYEIPDHLGNVRAVIGKAETENPKASFENSTYIDEGLKFGNYSRVNADLYDHTDEKGKIYTYAHLLHGGYNRQVGMAKSFDVSPGDVVKAEVYAKYEGTVGAPGNLGNFALALTGAFGLSPASIGEAAKAYDALYDRGSCIAAGLCNPDDDPLPDPRGYLTILVFDKNYNLVESSVKKIGSTFVQTGGQKKPFDYMWREVVIKEPGYVYIYLSNEGANQQSIYFDDLSITVNHSPVVAGADYYPFGLAMEGREINDEPYRYGFQGQFSVENDSTGWNEFELRMYDPRIGRWISPDPYRGVFDTPYSGMANQPHMTVDPDGGCPCPWLTSPGIWLPEVTVTAARIGAGAMASRIILQDGFKTWTGRGLMIEPQAEAPQPMSPQMQQWENNLAEVPTPNTAELSSGISPPGTLEGLIPIWGSGREAAAAFSAGSYWKGAAYTALAISDVFLVKAAITAVVRGGVTLAAKYALKRAVANPQMTIREAAAAVRVPRVASMMQGKGIDRAFRFYANRNWILGPAQRMGVVTLSPMNRGADMVGRRLLNGTWWDVTTRGAWQSHVLKYGPGGIPLIY
jgi:RHS repeat-associated protein